MRKSDNMIRLKGLFLILICFFSILVSAQVPSDLSTVRASQISDKQLLQYVNQAKANGLTPEQLERELLRRGLPASEMAELKIRIQQLDTGAGNTNEDETQSDTTSVLNSTRKANKRVNAEFESLEDFKKRTRIFGSELFSNANLTFEPDLRMATPRNYTIGPDDQLILNIYGLNITQQNLKVSPDGTVNVRYAGVINVNGLTMDAATALLKTRLARYYPALNSGGTKLELTLGNIRSIRVILIGAVVRPGTYTLPSLATLFNALYASGGPAENGSFRKIELIRNSKVIKVADLYDFLIKGDQQGNVSLEDNDVIRVPFASLLVTLEGELNRPGIFELQKDESLEDALTFAGGFKSKAFKGRITGNRYSDFDRRVIDVSGDSLRFFKPNNGDEYYIDSVLNRYQNRVIIKGAVFKPGAYAWESGMSLKTLINKAQGLKEDVFGGRAIVVRTRPDLTKEYVSVELKPIMTGNSEGLQLVKDDSVHIASIFDLKDTTTVTINGAVRNPGVYRYEDSLSLRSLILKAEGFTDDATGMGIEISRRKRDIDITKPGSDMVNLIKIDGNKDLSGGTTDITLSPFDIVTVKKDPYYKEQISVTVSGEVLMPAIYTLRSREERLSSLINRAGGLLYTANVGGAKLVRKKKLEAVDTSNVFRLFESVEKDTTKTQTKTQAITKDFTDVAINLNYILKHPGTRDDITLEEGDELIIPRLNNTVSVNGEVFKALDIMYERGKDLKDYLSDAGGVTPSGKRGRTFVIYANGRSAKIKRVLGIFPNYPRIEPGSSIFVPERKKGGFEVAKAGVIISAVASLLTALALIYR
jgi:protein involved in polysaccharide export with SLBB domain